VRSQSLQRSVVAAERERKRWARELHDETLQELAGLKLLLATARIAKDEQERKAQLERAGERVDIAVRALRDLITDLRPATLDELGLQSALEALAERVMRSTELSVELDFDLAYERGREPTRLPPNVEDTLYRLVQESLANVVKHAVATRAEVIVRERVDTIEVVIGDNGKGFEPDATFTGFGLLGMRERVALHDGTITIESRAGEGTTVRAAFPTERTSADTFDSGVGA
jgi:signal transduction histidine kinase